MATGQKNAAINRFFGGGAFEAGRLVDSFQRVSRISPVLDALTWGVGERVPERTSRAWRRVLAVLVAIPIVIFLLLGALVAALDLVGIIDLSRALSEEPIVLEPGDIYFQFQLSAFFALLVVAHTWLWFSHEGVWRYLGLLISRRAFVYVVLGAGLGAMEAFVLILLDGAGAFDAFAENGPDALFAVVVANPEFLFIIPIMAGVFEEILYRGWLQPRVGIPLSSALFGLAHFAGTWFTVVYISLTSLLLGYYYRRTGTLWGVIAWHTMYDFVLLWTIFI